MNLENELQHFKDELKQEEETLKKFETLDTSKMTEEQLEAHTFGITECKESIIEIKEIIDEIIEEMEA